MLLNAAATSGWVAIIILSISLATGGSEASYGGNYNLRYLDAEWRRVMRPGFDVPTSLNASGPGLHSMTPYSIYIPSAGFLWSDDLTWDSASGSFVNQKQVDEDSTLLGKRVVMKDPIGRFSPWLLQKDLEDSLNNGLKHDILLHREPVVLRSADSKQFLTVSSNPAHLEFEQEDNDAGRFAVS